ncbi:MAG: M20/M25/M40 family metallo-hydrolase [Planctomycetota bacterium]|jgi:tripeptide aminopeptidase|nr:M20/M25/M40 family metallo-hydrolase [Planctomycetota bacterium]
MPTRKSALLDNFLDLARIPSPSLRERGVADLLAGKIRALGHLPREDGAGQALGGDCGNLVVEIPGKGKGPRLLIAAHMDTVENPGDPPAKPVVEGEWVRREGGGILGADDKTGCAVMLEVMARLGADGRGHGDLTFVFTVAEEIEALGAAQLDTELYRDREAAVVLDYSKASSLVVAAPTKVAFRVTVHGIAGHAAFPENRINAAHVMAQTLARLPMGRLDGFTTANLGIVRSGTAINIIPGSAYAEYEIRSHRKDVLDFHVKRVIACVEGVVRENRLFLLGEDSGMGDAVAVPGEGIKIRHARVDVDVEVSYEGYRIPDQAPIVEKLGKALEKSGLTPELTVAQGGSDANIFNRRGLESVVLGCGMYGAHGADERANLKDMAGAVEALLNLIGGDGTSRRGGTGKKCGR